MDASRESRTRRQIALFLAGALPCLLFAVVTQHAWEDWYIAFRSAKNLASGHGLVFEQGQIVQTFTSPLNVLLPAGLSWLTGNAHDDLVLWLYRCGCAGLLGGTVLLLDRLARGLALSLPAHAFLLGFFLIDAKIMDFSINGQEAALMVFFLALQTVALIERRSLLLGLAWGGLMWSRPDSLVYMGGVTAGYLLSVVNAGRASLMSTMKGTGAAALIGAVIYAPWLWGATCYYGSPVPHSIIAKGLGFESRPLSTMIYYSARGMFTWHDSVLNDVFMPSYHAQGGWPTPLRVLSFVLALVAILAWLVPRISPLARTCSLGAFAGLFYGAILPGRPPWYLPPCTFLCILTLAALLDQGIRGMHERPGSQRGMIAAACATLLIWLCVTLGMAREMRLQQALIETGQRQQIGSWLKQHAASRHDTVFLECLGYIGFYSGLKMYDFPGISSPEVVQARVLPVSVFASRRTSVSARATIVPV